MTYQKSFLYIGVGVQLLGFMLMSACIFMNKAVPEFIGIMMGVGIVMVMLPTLTLGKKTRSSKNKIVKLDKRIGVSLILLYILLGLIAFISLD